MLVEWNDTSSVGLLETGVHELFAAQVKRRPEAPALVSAEGMVTYGELAGRAARLAARLRRLGVGPETPVGVCLERSPDLIVSLLGVLAAGGFYVPLDPTLPPERLALLLAEAGAGHVIGREDLRMALPAGLEWVVPGAAEHQATAEADWARMDGHSLAYLMFTSGSTGRPKGVAVTHRNILRLVRRPVYARLGAEETIFQLAPASFDASTFEIWGSLLHGGRLVLGPAPPPTLAELGGWLRRYEVTTLWLTAGLFHQVVEHTPEALAGLHQLLAGGDVLSPPAVRRALAHLAPRARLINGYGPTESTTFACCHAMSPGDEVGSPVPIGRPIGDTEAYVLDSELRPVPRGAEGELFLGGEGLARGYLGRPELTAASFVPHPFASQPGARLYRTGDRAQWTAGGRLEFLGRLDHQVKVRGFRIEPGEIEAALLREAGVRSAAVTARTDGSGDKVLVAYVVPVASPSTNEGSEAGEKLLREALARSLPAYMVPGHFVFLPELPLTANGKVDRAALPAPAAGAPATGADTGYEAPSGPVEAIVAGLYSELFGVARVGRSDDFFALGGHSLLATQLLARLRTALGRELPLEAVFTAPTPAALARLVEASAARPEPAPEEPLRPVPRVAEMPVSAAQERIWFLQQLAPESLAYNFQAALRFTGELDVAALAGALAAMVRRHEIFRTAFPARGGQSWQEIHPDWPVELPVVDLTAVSPGAEAAIEACSRQMFRRAFDLLRLPLIRWTLLRLAPREHLLLHSEHHLLHDGWSFNIFRSELAELYAAGRAGRAAVLPPLPVQFADFAAWQRRWLAGPAAAAQLNYWRERLAGAPQRVELPADRPRPAVQRFRGGVSRIELPAELYTALRAWGERQGVTLFMSLLTAFFALLHRYAAQTDLRLGCGIANRRLRETEGLIGMIINMVVLRVDAGGDPALRDLLARVRSATLGAYAHQDLPFEKIVEALQPERDLSYNPFFQTAFSFHDAPLPEHAYPGLEVEVTEGLGNGSAKFDLNVIAIPRAEQRIGAGRRAGEGLTLLWEHNTDLFSAATMARMVDHYQQLLAALPASQDLRLSELPLLSDGQTHQILAEWNDTARPGACQALAHELVAARAAEHPERPAVVSGGSGDGSGPVTYGELNRRADQLARFLRARGVGPEAVVALCLERSADLVTAALAVLKAGGAYLPVDPAYPPERIAYLLDDADPAVVLTRRAWAASLPRPGRPDRVVFLEDLRAELARRSAAELAGGEMPPDRMAEHLAYVIYTSGSAGQPKGVELRHGGLAHLIAWHLETYRLAPGDRVTQVASPSFDAAVWEVWPCLAAGASLYLPDEPTRSSAAALARWLADQRITVCFLPTPLAEAVLDEGLPAGGALRALLTGGDRLLRRPSPVWTFHLVNHYGPTEDTVVATSARVAPAAPLDSAPPIGRPITGQRACLVDRHLGLVPLGAAGELLLGGAGLARGYRRDAPRTAERFIPDPFAAAPGERLYRTGDLARWSAAGELEFLGRVDRQIKVRGFRIEPAEIEAALLEHPGVRECAVVARDGLPGGRGLVAYYVAAAGPATPAVSAAELRELLERKIPGFMVPAAFMALPTLPLGPHGKVDHAALPAPESLDGEAYIAPEGPVEELLAELWSETLGVSRIGARDNFFRLGGHSLRATRMLSRLAEVTQIDLPLRELFVAPTLSDLAAVVETLMLREMDSGEELSGGAE